jgi:hypothetical protein
MFFIQNEGEERAEGPVDNIECTRCHAMYHVSVRS